MAINVDGAMPEDNGFRYGFYSRRPVRKSGLLEQDFTFFETTNSHHGLYNIRT